MDDEDGPKVINYKGRWEQEGQSKRRRYDNGSRVCSDKEGARSPGMQLLEAGRGKEMNSP